MKRLPALLVLLTACSASLDLADDIEVLCATNDDCVGGRLCAPAGFCVKELSTTPLTLLAASALDGKQVELIFDQALVADVALDADRYDVTPALAIEDVYASGAAKVVLRTDQQVLGVPYAVRANGLVSRDGIFLDEAAASATFLGFGVPSDTSPPKPISPTHDMLVVGTQQLLVWTPRVGASSYTVTLARDADCNSVITTAVVLASNSSLAVTLPGTGRFFWCVTADITANQELGTAAFHATDDAVYVYCAYNDACDFTTNEVGSPAAPFRSVRRAISLAQQRGLSAVRIAGRGAGAVYSEVVQVTGRGIDLEGGYAPTFATRDPSLHPTSFKFASSSLVITDVQSKMAVNGLGFEAAETQSNVAVLISSAAAPIALTNLTIRANGRYPIGIAIADAGSVTLHASRVTTSDGSRLTGIQVQGQSNLYVTDSQVLVGHGDVSSTAIAALDARGSIDVARSTVMSGESYDGVTYGIVTAGALGVHDSRIVARQTLRAYAITMGSGVVERSFVYANAGIQGIGLGVKGVPALVRGNLIVGSGTASVGVSLEGGPSDCTGTLSQRVVGNTVLATYRALKMAAGAPIVTNNVFYATDIAVEEDATGPDVIDPLSFENNALIAALPYREWSAPPNSAGGVAADHETAEAVNAMSGAFCLNHTDIQVRYSGNLGGEASPTAIFTDMDGADNLLFEVGDATIFETADNDFTLHAAAVSLGVHVGGKDATASTCGSGAQPCEGEATDLAGRPRTIPWSIGAYERD